MKKIVYLFSVICSFLLNAQQNIVTSGSTWKYNDNGIDLDTAWYASNYNDSSWLIGNAQFGYGDGDETTMVSFGANSANKQPTTYFRKEIDIVDLASFTSFILNIKRDDGAIIYVNGIEVNRSNMPVGSVTYSTFALSNCADDGNIWNAITLLPTSFVEGTNLIAVEIHQINGTSSDLSFDMNLTGYQSTTVIPTVTRGRIYKFPQKTA